MTEPDGADATPADPAASSPSPAPSADAPGTTSSGAPGGTPRPESGIRRSLLVLLGLVAVLGTTTLIWSLTRDRAPATLYLINALDHPVAFVINDQALTLAPGQFAVTPHEPGFDFRMRAEIDGRVIDERTVNLAPGLHLLWSPAGAAPVTLADESRVAVLAGPDAAFTELPSDLRVAFDPEETRPGPRELRLESDCHWRVTLNLLRAHATPADAAALAEAVWRAQPTDPPAQDAALKLAGIVHGADRLLELGREMTTAGVATVDSQVLVQEIRMRREPLEPLRDEYRARYDEHPDSKVAAMLLARCLRQQPALQLHEELAARYPDFAWLHRDRAWRLWVARRHDEAAAAWARAAELDPDRALGLLPMRVHALVSAGRVADARQLLDTVGGELLAAHRRDTELAILWARLAPLAEPADDGAAPDPDKWAGHFLADRSPEAWQRFLALSGRPDEEAVDALPDSPAKTDLRILLALVDDPDAAVELAQRAPADTRQRLSDEPAAVVLAGRLGLAGHAEEAQQVLASVALLDHDQRQALEAFVADGTDSPLLAEIGVDLQAAVELVRALRAESGSEQRSQWLAQARRDALPGGIVARSASALAGGDGDD